VWGRLVLLVAIAACGRVAFAPAPAPVPDASDPLGDGATDDARVVQSCAITHPQALLCDGFEATDMGPWNYLVQQQGRAERTTARAFLGAASLETETFDVSVTKAARWGLSDLFSGLDAGDLYVRAYLQLSSATQIVDHASILVVANGSPPYPSTFVLLRPGTLSVLTDGVGIAVPYAFPRDRWVCVQLHIAIASDGYTELSVDGEQVARTAAMNTRVAGGYTTLDVGVHYATAPQPPVQLWIDEVVADTSPIACAE
jgi:hypothetical protein